MTYGKVFESLWCGSMVGKGSTVFAVWTYCISNCKPVPIRRGDAPRRAYIELNPNILAAIIGTALTDVEAAIELLCSPDPASRTTDHDGRRLLTDGLPNFTYELATFDKYDRIRKDEDRREQNRKAQERFRNKSAVVSGSKQSKPTETETETETETYQSIDPKGSHPSAEGNPEPVKKRGVYSDGFEAWWKAYPRQAGSKKKAFEYWKRVAKDPAVRQQIMDQTAVLAANVTDEGLVSYPTTWLNGACWETDQRSSAACKDDRGGKPKTMFDRLNESGTYVEGAPEEKDW